MKKLMLNKIVFMLFLFVTTIFSAVAQDADVIKSEGKTPQERSEHQAKKLTKVIPLTAEQTPQVQAALLDRMTKMATMKTTVEKGDGKQKEAAKAIMAEFDAKMKTILTPEQYTKFEQTREDKKEKMMEKRMEKRKDRKEKKAEEGKS
jgi:Spy/CpxP family protein refolding chaperone